MGIIGLNIVNCKIVKHCFDGLYGTSDYNPEHRGIEVQFIEQTKVFDADRKEVNIKDYFKDVKDRLWVSINKTKEDDGPFWKIYYPTTIVFYLLNGEKFNYAHEVSLEDADALFNPEKEYIAVIRLRLFERRQHFDEINNYSGYASRIIIKEKD